ncbi:Sexual development regulator velC [Pseudocercospora fuligena]|uniref:Sexual development regulator velC n=1 Tax=Pseudocercospora fuligena TaxID=685502 RepID=A0A8H6RSY2_9PEZI|nr:Sexual development regulator velC [Pseudocercospora fuligena]
MAQIQHQSTFPPPNFLGRPEQRSSGPQLPPIHSVPAHRSSQEHGGSSVQLPPMQVAPPGPSSPSRAPTRSIPVAQLLSSNPPSPPRSQPAIAAQQPVYRRSPTSSGNSTLEPRIPPQQYQQAPQYRYDQISISQRQPQPIFQQEPYANAQYSRSQYPNARPTVSTEHSAPRQHSPALSSFSSPTSYTHSEASPRSSLAPSSYSRSQRNQVQQPPPLNYTLSIRQQPAAARACGFGERDRRVIDPPPILELKITDRDGVPECDSTGMLALSCMLLSPDGSADETELPPAHPDAPSTRRLMGTLVASPYPAKDENNHAGTFFVFPDLSCRSPGKYRLKFKLLRIDPTNNLPGVKFKGDVATIVTEVFSVYTAKDFPGMRASSALLKSLRRQGLNVGVKKGSEARKGKGKPKKEIESSASSDNDSDGGGSDSSGSNSPNSKSKSRKKGKRRKHDE